MSNTREHVDLILDRRKFLTLSAAASMAVMTSSLIGCKKETPQEPDHDADTKSGIAATDENLVKRSTFAFDTLIFLSAYGSEKCLDECLDLCVLYDNLFSAHKEGTDIWKINHAKGKPVKVHEDTADLIKRSLEFCELSKGKFDITIGAVSLLWDFEKGVKPSDEAIKAGLPHVDYRKVEVNGTTVRLLDPDAMLDLGGTAKGWIADKFASVYAKHGVKAGIINLGGNVYAVGEKPGGKPWKIAIKDPNNPDGDYLLVVEVKNRSVVTSGLYERHFVKDGVDYTHILDTKTGYPVKTDMLADTIIAESSLVCDGLSTTLFIDGIQKANEVVDEQTGVEALFIDKENRLYFTKGFEELYPYEKRSDAIVKQEG